MGQQRREASAKITATFLLLVMSLLSYNGVSPSLSTTSSPTASPASETPSVTSLPASPIKNYIVSGTIITGGDTTPPDLVDAPRVFSYLIGDYMQARGSYDAPKKTLVVAEEGDFIETYATEP